MNNRRPHRKARSCLAAVLCAALLSSGVPLGEARYEAQELVGSETGVAAAGSSQVAGEGGEQNPGEGQNPGGPQDASGAEGAGSEGAGSEDAQHAQKRDSGIHRTSDDHADRRRI